MNKTSSKKAGKRTKKKIRAKDYERGRVEKIVLKKAITFNGSQITHAVIEIDHINYGLDKKTLKLNTKKRSSFTLADIEKFLALLDDEYIAPKSYKGRVSRYEIRIDSPIKDAHYGKQYLLVFDINFDLSHQLHTITLFPGW